MSEEERILNLLKQELTRVKSGDKNFEHALSKLLKKDGVGEKKLLQMLRDEFLPDFEGASKGESKGESEQDIVKDIVAEVQKWILAKNPNLFKVLNLLWEAAQVMKPGEASNQVNETSQTTSSQNEVQEKQDAPMHDCPNDKAVEDILQKAIEACPEATGEHIERLVKYLAKIGARSIIKSPQKAQENFGRKWDELINNPKKLKKVLRPSRLSRVMGAVKSRINSMRNHRGNRTTETQQVNTNNLVVQAAKASYNLSKMVVCPVTTPLNGFRRAVRRKRGQ